MPSGSTDPIAYLFSLEQFGIKLGLENIRALCDALGRPQSAYRSIIVAGTNGKGSVTAMVETALRAAGIRAARYTSPHLVRLEERFVIDGAPVPTEALRDAAATVRDAAERLRAAARLATHPTFFEATTAAAFELFRRAGVGVVVLEVGLGGRFDATNVASPIAGAIVSIDLDHERYLGTTIPAIAAEKAGIVKPGMVVVVGETKADAVAVIERTCRERSARFVAAGDGVRADVALHEGRVRLDLATPARRYGPLMLALRGRHQAANAVVAVRLLEELGGLGLPVPAGAIAAGLTCTAWRGRLELLRVGADRQVLLDAAHNPAGAAALASYLREVHPAGLPVVFGTMRDKDVAGMLAPLAPLATRIVCTAARTPRAIPAPDLAARARARVAAPIDVEPDPIAALDRAWAAGPTICVTGSLFLVGDILAALDARADVRPA